MFHLFNKVYLKGDHQIKMERDRIVISPTYAAVNVLTAKFASAANETSVGEVYFAGRTLKELVDNNFGGNESKFFAYLIAFDPSKRLTIYVDLPTMGYLVTRFYKTLFPKMSEETFIKLFKFVFLRINYIYGVGYLPFVKLPEIRAEEYRVQSADLVNNVETLKQHWATIKPWRMIRSQKDTIVKGAGVEYQLATHFTKDKWLGKQEFQDKIVVMMKKQIVHDYALDIKHRILSSFVNLKLLEPTATFDPFVNTIEDFIAQFPEYSFLTDDKFVPDNYEYVWKNYDMDVLLAVRNKFESFCPYQIVPQRQEFLTNDLSFDKIINYEVGSQARYAFTADTYQETVNPYIIDYILEMKKANNLDALREFSL